MKFWMRTFISWLPLAVAITGLCGLIYVAVQQDYRQSLNDPQIQMAEDAAAKLAAGTQSSEIVPDPDTVNIVSSLAPWLAIYNDDGMSIISSGTFNGAIPEPPKGVFEAARTDVGKDTDQQNEDRVTWQSGAGVRQALVIVHYDSPTGGGFVVAGRNMREVEDREGNLTLILGIGLLVLLAVTFVAKVFAVFLA